MKQSLWDLKRTFWSTRRLGVWQIMKQSLWDLKPNPSSLTIFRELYYEAIPMGFETNCSSKIAWAKRHYEAIPMGFET